MVRWQKAGGLCVPIGTCSPPFRGSRLLVWLEDPRSSPDMFSETICQLYLPSLLPCSMGLCEWKLGRPQRTVSKGHIEDAGLSFEALKIAP